MSGAYPCDGVTCGVRICAHGVAMHRAAGQWPCPVLRCPYAVTVEEAAAIDRELFGPTARLELHAERLRAMVDA